MNLTTTLQGTIHVVPIKEPYGVKGPFSKNNFHAIIHFALQLQLHHLLLLQHLGRIGADHLEGLEQDGGNNTCQYHTQCPCVDER